MQVHWNEADPSVWDALHRGAGGALQQHRAYREAMRALGVECLSARVEDGGQTLALAQFLIRKVIGWIPVALCSHGPVWTPGLPPEQQAEVLAALRRSVPLRWPRALLYTPDSSRDQAEGFARLRRVMTGHATVRIDLTQSLDALRAAQNGKWRNRLAAAERSGLKVERLGSRPAQYRWLLDHELAQRGRRGYIALPDGFIEAYQTACRSTGAQTEDPVYGLRLDADRSPIAGMLFLVHGEAATYQIGWASEAGRQVDAHTLMLWQAVQALKARGVRSLDLGGVDTQRGAGLARFKIGTGGAVITLAGTYLG